MIHITEYLQLGSGLTEHLDLEGLSFLICKMVRFGLYIPFIRVILSLSSPFGDLEMP